MLEIRSRSNLLELLKANSNEREVLLKIKPTVPLITSILSHMKVETIYCSPKIYALLTQKTLSALREVGVRVETIQTKMGRPPIHASKKIQLIQALRAQGKKPEQIAEQTGMPLRTVYYYLNGK